MLLFIAVVGVATAPVTRREQPLVIEQVDYEPYIHPGLDGMPVVNLSQVNYSKFVNKTHRSVVLESEYAIVTLLPAMGRVYSIFHKPSQHHVLWKNDIAWPGGANNALGWWLWIGGIEYTLPGEEHGYTWALEWGWEMPESDADTDSVSVSAWVTEPTTQLREELTWTLAAGSSALQTRVTIHNPTQGIQRFAHWVNVPFVPGGENQLTDNTEFIIPTKRVNVSERWQSNLGPSPQQWATSPLRQIAGWKGMGDITSDGLAEGFFGAYSHDKGEGGVRIFDPDTNPGLDTWTYGYHPGKGIVPMGSGAYSKGYAEMWGGNVKTFPEERAQIGPNATVEWVEHVYAFTDTGGLDAATAAAAARASCSDGGLTVWVCPTAAMAAARLEVWAGTAAVARVSFDTDPSTPYKWEVNPATIPPNACRASAATPAGVTAGDGSDGSLEVRMYDSSSNCLLRFIVSKSPSASSGS